MGIGHLLVPLLLALSVDIVLNDLILLLKRLNWHLKHLHKWCVAVGLLVVLIEILRQAWLGQDEAGAQ